MKQRVVVPEKMDDPNIALPLHKQALVGLARLNRWSRSDVGLWKVLKQEAAVVAPLPLKVLDVATGSGDLPIRLAKKAKQAKLNIEWAGCDISPTALAVADTSAKKHQAKIRFFACDVFREGLPQGYDVIMTSLFLHHLSEVQAKALLQSMASVAKRTVLVNDLQRSRVNVGLVTIACHTLSRSPVVHYDGPASVRAAFTIPEALALAQSAGLIGATITRQFPCRWLLRWSKPAC